jgi:hypothetical protein
MKMKRDNRYEQQLPGLKGQLPLLARQGQHTLALGWGMVINEYCQMPEASNVYRKTEVGEGSTPPGSNVFHLNIFYKHTNPLGLSDFTSIS